MKKNVLWKFIETSVWPQQPELEPGWFRCIRGALQQGMYRTPISSLDDLKDWVRTSWENLGQQIIDTFDHWRDKLKAMVRLNGGHIEQLFWLPGLFAVVLCYVAYVF